MRSNRRRYDWGSFLLASLAPLLGACTAPEMLLTGGTTAGVAVSQERGPGGAIDDNAIAAGINKRWLDHDWKIFRDVSTSVSEGRVMLTGNVAREQDELEAVRLTWEVGGVRQVYDDIKVTNDGGAAGYLRDTWISTQIRTDLTFDNKIRAVNYNVVTVDGVVHVLGIAQNDDEVDRIMQYARSVRYVRDVVSHVVLKDDPNRYATGQPPADDGNGNDKASDSQAKPAAEQPGAQQSAAKEPPGPASGAAKPAALQPVSVEPLPAQSSMPASTPESGAKQLGTTKQPDANQ